jgi:hypothetical protein
MASQGLIDLLEKANTDPQFRINLERNPEKVMEEFNLSHEEKEAVLSRRTAKLRELDIELRLAKGFAADNGNKISIMK